MLLEQKASIVEMTRASTFAARPVRS